MIGIEQPRSRFDDQSISILVQVVVLVFEYLNDLYGNDDDFKSTYMACQHGAQGQFVIKDGYLLLGNWFCI